MAKLFNSSSNSPIKVSRRVKKIVSQIQTLVEKFPECCWYDGSWWCGGTTVITETECRGIEYGNEGLYFYYADFYGDTHHKVIPYDAKLLSRLRNLQQKIHVGIYHVYSVFSLENQKVINTVPAWALKRGCYPYI